MRQHTMVRTIQRRIRAAGVVLGLCVLAASAAHANQGWSDARLLDHIQRSLAETHQVALRGDQAAADVRARLLPAERLLRLCAERGGQNCQSNGFVQHLFNSGIVPRNPDETQNQGGNAPVPDPSEQSSVPLPPMNTVCTQEPTNPPGGRVCYTDFVGQNCVRITQYDSQASRIPIWRDREIREEPARCPPAVLQQRSAQAEPALPEYLMDTVVRGAMEMGLLRFIAPQQVLAEIGTSRRPVAAAPVAVAQPAYVPPPAASGGGSSFDFGQFLSGAGEVLGFGLGVAGAVLGVIAGSRGVAVPSMPSFSAPRSAPTYSHPQGITPGRPSGISAAGTGGPGGSSSGSAR